jgi:hypothetical protein
MRILVQPRHGLNERNRGGGETAIKQFAIGR